MSSTEPKPTGQGAPGRPGGVQSPSRPLPQGAPAKGTRLGAPSAAGAATTNPVPADAGSVMSGPPTAPTPLTPMSTSAPAPRPAETTPVRPQTGPVAAAPAAPTATARPGAPRKVRLNLARLDPWSVLKLSFLLSVGLGIATVVATLVVWQVLNGMGVFTQLNSLVRDIIGSQAGVTFDLYSYVGRSRVLSLATVLAVVNVVLLTALSTLGAFLYNLSAGLVGGLHVTLSDD